MLKRVVAEPLFHFLLAALAIFAVYGFLNRGAASGQDEVLVTPARIEQLAGLFARSRQRPPTPQELKGLIDDHVAEEIYYREALARGLDKDDATIRRRLRLKMDYLEEAETATLTPTDAQLEAYLKANAAAYEIDPQYAFQQIYFNPRDRGAKIDADAEAVLAEIKAKPPADASTLGDDTLLPFETPLTPSEEIARVFGQAFADALARAPVGTWAGPFVSTYGLHLAKIGEKTPGRTPTLEEARAALSRDWANEERKRLHAERFADLLKRYKVTIQLPPEPASK